MIRSKPLLNSSELQNQAIRPSSRGQAYNALVGGAIEEGVTGFAYRKFKRAGNDFGDTLDLEDANAEFGIEGILQFDEPVTRYRANELHGIKTRELIRSDVLSRGPVGTKEAFAVSIAASLIDPLGDAIALVPFVGGGAKVGQAANTAKKATTFARAVQGFKIGASQAAIAETLIFPLATLDERRDYGAKDILFNIALSGGIGSAGRVIAGHFSDRAALVENENISAIPEAEPIIERADPKTRHAAFQSAVERVADDKPVLSAEILQAAEKARLNEVDIERPSIELNEIRDDVAIDPTGDETAIKYAIVELKSLIPSHNIDLSKNPDYPQALQPRDRGRAASETQINKIANDLNPALLGEAPQADAGAPIISPDGIVESGNARTIALMRAYAGKNGVFYKQYLVEKDYPIDGFEQPVLVRVTENGRKASERVDFARRANSRGTAAMSVAEQALADAKALTPAVFDLHAGEGSDLSRNPKFVRAVLEAVSSEAERGVLIDARGQLSVDGQRRVDAAVAAYAYDDGGLISAMLETTDTNIRGIGRALVEAAPAWSKLRAEARAGDIPMEADTTGYLISAVNLVRDARRSDKTIVEITGQTDMFSGSLDPKTVAFLRVFFTGKEFSRQRSADKIRADLDFYVQEARKSQPGPNLLGDIDADPAPRILAHILEKQDAADPAARALRGFVENAEPGSRGRSRSETQSNPAQGQPVFARTRDSETGQEPQLDSEYEGNIDGIDPDLTREISELENEISALEQAGLIDDADLELLTNTDIDTKNNATPDAVRAATFCLKQGGQV